MSDDIEDIWKEAADLNNEKRQDKNTVKMKKKAAAAVSCCGKQEVCCGGAGPKKKESEEKEQQDKENVEKHENELQDGDKNIIPGTQNIMFKTYGCSHNTSDSEYMMGLLAEYGYKLVDNFENAQLCVINSCTVKNPSQDAFINYIAKARSTGKKIVVAGCVPQGDRNIKGMEDCSMIGVTQIDRIVEVVEETLKGHQVNLYN
jgi:threonylcarbamoyladenosine tRNA methylthiotransferase CDKAL1